MYLGFIIYVTVIVTIFCLIKFPKFRLYFAAVVLMAIFIFGCCALQNAARAEDLDVKEGVITRVAPELFNGYPILIVTVETFDGQIYTYYSEDEIDTEGVVILTLFGDEVLNVE